MSASDIIELQDEADLQKYLDTLNREIDETKAQAATSSKNSPASTKSQQLKPKLTRQLTKANTAARNANESDKLRQTSIVGHLVKQRASPSEMTSTRSIVSKKIKLEPTPKNQNEYIGDTDEASQSDNIITFSLDDGEEVDEELKRELESIREEQQAMVMSDNEDNADADDPQEVYEFDENDDETDNNISQVSVGRRVGRLKTNSGKDDVYSCPHCNYKTAKNFLLVRHMNCHADDKPFKCSVCDRGFKTNASLTNHTNIHMGNKPHKCKECPSAFTTSGELMRHRRYRHTGEKPFKCTECDYCSVELSKLRRHMRCHTGERPYQCPHCTYASADTFKLKRHLRTHTGEKPYECDICKARFTQQNSMKIHRLIHSVNDKPVFNCTLCPVTCGRKADLRIHMLKLHTAEKPIPCKRCGQELPDRYSFKLHMKTHVGEKCFRCELCPYASITLRHLESHMYIHSDEKPFQCEQCPANFRQKQLLVRHINIHHSTEYVPTMPREKIHTCPHCERSFAHKGNLIRHMAVHDPDLNSNEIEASAISNEQYEEGDVLYDIYEGANEDGTFNADEEGKPIVLNFESLEGGSSSSDKKTLSGSAQYLKMEKQASANKSNGNVIQVVNGADSDQEEYMYLEVFDEEDDDDSNCCIIINNQTVNKSTTKTNANMENDIKHSFGFEEDDIEDVNQNAQNI